MALFDETRRVAVVIEDDANIRRLLELTLTEAGFDTIAASNGVDGIRAVRAYDPLVTTLDISMPGMDGFEVAKRIREFSGTYVIMLTARDEEIDALQGLQAGADDYVTKPFRPRELRARIDAMLRRARMPLPAAVQPVAPASSHPVEQTALPSESRVAAPTTAPVPAAATPIAHTSAAAQPSPPLVPTTSDAEPDRIAVPAGSTEIDSDEGWTEHNGLRVNTDLRLAVLQGTDLDLTRPEFDLLVTLFESNRRLRSKADLALVLHGESYVTSYFVTDNDKRAVEVHMENLRRKLGDSYTTPRWLEAVGGVGFRLAPTVSAP